MTSGEPFSLSGFQASQLLKGAMPASVLKELMGRSKVMTFEPLVQNEEPLVECRDENSYFHYEVECSGPSLLAGALQIWGSGFSL